MNGIGPGEIRLEKKEREISATTDGFDPGVLSPPAIPSAYLRASKEMWPWGMREWGWEEHSILHKHSFPCRPCRPALSSSQRAGRNEVKHWGNQMGPPCSPHRVCAQSCCQPSLPGRDRAHLPIQKKKKKNKKK